MVNLKQEETSKNILIFLEKLLDVLRKTS